MAIAFRNSSNDNRSSCPNCNPGYCYEQIKKHHILLGRAMWCLLSKYGSTHFSASYFLSLL